MRPARKYILIPEYRPLYAMRDCFGPTHGPLQKPCPTPLDVIRRLLMQSGSEKLTIMEVLKNPDGTHTTPVQLTLENYTLPYEEILHGVKMPEKTTITELTADGMGVKPVVIRHDAPADKIPETPAEKPTPTAVESETPDNEPNQEQSEKSLETTEAEAPAADTDTAATDEESADEEAQTDESADPDEDLAESEPEATETVTVEETNNVVIETAQKGTDPYAGMTKAQRRAARREAAKNQQNTGSVETV